MAIQRSCDVQQMHVTIFGRYSLHVSYIPTTSFTFFCSFTYLVSCRPRGGCPGFTSLHKACLCSIEFGYVRLNIEGIMDLARELKAPIVVKQSNECSHDFIWSDHCLFIVEYSNTNTTIFVPSIPTQQARPSCCYSFICSTLHQ
jgi:hypothetical protein